MLLEPNHIHIWSTTLSIDPVQEKHLLSLLSPDEQVRIHRIRLSAAKQRAIASRGLLRTILSYYLNVAPELIQLGAGEHNKPYLIQPTHANVKFNLAHSNDEVVYAITLNADIGVDIEKMKTAFNPAIAERYFSPQENTELTELSLNEQSHAFYRIWARKEAMVKAIGSGLSLPLSSFTVAANNIAETIELQAKTWFLQPLSILPDYASAVACQQIIKCISYWRPTTDGYTMIT